MKKNLKKTGTPESFITVLYDLKEVQSAEDVAHNLERYIYGHFTIPQRVEILSALQETKDAYHDLLHNGFYQNGFDYDLFWQCYENSKSFKKWRSKLENWTRSDVDHELSSQFLDTYFQSQMIDDQDLRSEVLEGKWHHDIQPLLKR